MGEPTHQAPQAGSHQRLKMHPSSIQGATPRLHSAGFAGAPGPGGRRASGAAACTQRRRHPWHAPCRCGDSASRVLLCFQHPRPPFHTTCLPPANPMFQSSCCCCCSCAAAAAARRRARCRCRSADRTPCGAGCAVWAGHAHGEGLHARLGCRLRQRTMARALAGSACRACGAGRRMVGSVEMTIDIAELLTSSATARIALPPPAWPSLLPSSYTPRTLAGRSLQTYRPAELWKGPPCRWFPWQKPEQSPQP